MAVCLITDRGGEFRFTLEAHQNAGWRRDGYSCDVYGARCAAPDAIFQYRFLAGLPAALGTDVRIPHAPELQRFALGTRFN